MVLLMRYGIKLSEGLKQKRVKYCSTHFNIKLCRTHYNTDLFFILGIKNSTINSIRLYLNSKQVNNCNKNDFFRRYLVIISIYSIVYMMFELFMHLSSREQLG